MNIFGKSLPLTLVALWSALAFARTAQPQDVLPAATSVPNWIAAPGAPAAAEQAYFRHQVDITQPVTSAWLVAAASDAGIDFYLDGKLIFEFDPYDPLLKLDLTQEL